MVSDEYEAASEEKGNLLSILLNDLTDKKNVNDQDVSLTESGLSFSMALWVYF